MPALKVDYEGFKEVFDVYKKSSPTQSKGSNGSQGRADLTQGVDGTTSEDGGDGENLCPDGWTFDQMFQSDCYEGFHYFALACIVLFLIIIMASAGYAICQYMKKKKNAQNEVQKFVESVEIAPMHPDFAINEVTESDRTKVDGLSFVGNSQTNISVKTKN